jgi:hypothetical protein
MPDLKAMKAASDKMSRLLADPQPGLSTWWEFLAEIYRQLKRAAGDKEQEPDGQG